jgi:hypothetical protein
MKQKTLITLIFIATSIVCYGQESKELQFNINQFNKNREVAEWLCQYDVIAWWTSDSVSAQDKKEIQRLGQEWFCFKDKNQIWHALYGKFQNQQFDMVFHYTVDTLSNVVRSYEKIDSILTNPYCRALQTSNKQLEKLRDTIPVKFNQYIKKNDDKTFTVWILPAFHPNRVAVYGGQFIYQLDETGTKITKDESYYKGQFKGIRVGKPREIWLDYTELDQPNLETTFFVWYYKEYFTAIKIETKKHVSTVMKNKNNQYYWLHLEKATDKK